MASGLVSEPGISLYVTRHEKGRDFVIRLPYIEQPVRVSSENPSLVLYSASKFQIPVEAAYLSILHGLMILTTVYIMKQNIYFSQKLQLIPCYIDMTNSSSSARLVGTIISEQLYRTPKRTQ